MAASLALLVLAWVVVPPGPHPPLYDGVGFPDEPYRYVDPPAGSTPTKPPTDAVDTEPANAQFLATFSLESAAQVQANIPAEDLIIPPGATSITARFQPLAPVPPLPADGVVWGNVYRLTITTPQGPVKVKPNDDPGFYLELRAPSGDQPPPVIEAYILGSWHRLPTNQDGNDIYGTQMIGIGDYAVVRTTPNAPNTPSQHSTFNPLLFILIGLLALLAIGVLAVRFTRRSKRRAPARLE